MERTIQPFAFRKMTILLLQLIVLHVNTPAMTQNTDWTMTYQNGYGETLEIPMSNVGSLVAVDDAYDFAILSPSGELLAEKVLNVSFQLNDATGIIPVTRRSDKIIVLTASDKLTILGIQGKVEVYDVRGTLKAYTIADGGETIIQVSQLPSSIYIVRAGGQTFKFSKK